MNSLPDGDMHVLADYPNLKSLSLHVQAIPQVVGLEGMRQLQRLSMTECGLTSMHGIECCKRLTFLDLSMNQIAEMDANVLQHLGQLQTLWMNENLVTQIEGLAPLKKLTTLWLARNQISSIGDTLDAKEEAALKHLQEEFFGPAGQQSWEGVELAAYWEGVGKRLMTERLYSKPK